MKSKLNYQILLSRIARNAYKLHNMRKEWKVFILFVFLAKVLTWSISIFAGYNYFSSLLFPVMQNKLFANITAITILIIVEVLTTIALAKFFKFLFRGTSYLSTIIALVLVVGALFGLSFVSSTNGLAMRQSQKVDNTDIIIDRFGFQEHAVKNEYKDRLLNINGQIATIKSNPQGWTNGRRSTLIAGQLASIDSLQKRKAELRQEQKTEIVLIDKQKLTEMQKNKKQTTSEADKYYKIIMWVMIIQFIASGTLMFFWKRILNEDDQEVLISEKIKSLKDTMVGNAYHAAINEFSGISNLITTQLALSNEKYQPEIPIENVPESLPIEAEPEKRVQIAGFNNRLKTENKTENKNTDKPVKPSIRIDGNKDLKPEILHEKNIDFLGKHKIIVRSIKQINLAEKESISNNEIRRVKEAAKRAKFKSKTLIREVYKVAVTVGLNKIDMDGNIKLIS